MFNSAWEQGFLKSFPNETARGIYAKSRSNSSVKLQTDVNVELAAAETLQISSDGSNYSFGISAEGAKTAVDVQAKDLSISSIGSKAYGVKTKSNAEINIAADDVVIDVKNQADKATAETYGLLVEAGSSGYGKLFKSTLNNRLCSNLACVIDESSRGVKLKRAFEELPMSAILQSPLVMPIL